jgi:hypothetical protein
MTIKHGTDRRYSDGCRCDECREAHKLKARKRRDRKRRGLTRPALLTAVMSMESSGPGPVELDVETELAGLAAARERAGVGSDDSGLGAAHGWSGGDLEAGRGSAAR